MNTEMMKDNVVYLENYSMLTDEELISVEGGAVPLLIVGAFSAKTAGYVTGGLTAVGIATLGYFKNR